MVYRVVAVDVLFFLNFLVNLALLTAVAAWCGLPGRRWRIGLAAALGALAAVLAQFPGPGRWLGSLPGGGLVSAVMIAAAFAPWPARRTLGLLASLYAVAFVMAGGALAATMAFAGPHGLIWLEGQGSGYRVAGAGVPAAAGLVAAGIGFSLAGGRLIWQRQRTRIRLEPALVPLIFACHGRSLTLTGLIDTGHHLREPFSGQPVVVASYRSVRPLLPPAVRQVIDAAFAGQPNVEPDLLALAALPASVRERCRLVPFASVGRSRGLLLAWRFDSMEVQHGPVRQRLLAQWVGLVAGHLHGEGLYQALLPPQALRQQIPGVQHLPGWDGSVATELTATAKRQAKGVKNLVSGPPI